MRGKLIFSHEAIKILKWQKMTMDFKVQNKFGLAAIRSGMAVDFEIVQQDKGCRILRIVPVKK